MFGWKNKIKATPYREDLLRQADELELLKGIYAAESINVEAEDEKEYFHWLQKKVVALETATQLIRQKANEQLAE